MNKLNQKSSPAKQATAITLVAAMVLTLPNFPLWAEDPVVVTGNATPRSSFRSYLEAPNQQTQNQPTNVTYYNLLAEVTVRIAESLFSKAGPNAMAGFSHDVYTQVT